jgi:hypothetical protein
MINETEKHTETTAYTMAYTCALLALDQNEQERVYQHIKSVIGDSEPVRNLALPLHNTNVNTDIQ